MKIVKQTTGWCSNRPPSDRLKRRNALWDGWVCAVSSHHTHRFSLHPGVSHANTTSSSQCDIILNVTSSWMWHRCQCDFKHADTRTWSISSSTSSSFFSFLPLLSSLPPFCPQWLRLRLLSLLHSLLLFLLCFIILLSVVQSRCVCVCVCFSPNCRAFRCL